jgi:hypothetical protein
MWLLLQKNSFETNKTYHQLYVAKLLNVADVGFFVDDFE